MYRYSIPQLISEAFGIGVTALYLRLLRPEEQPLPQYENLPVLQAHSRQLTSYLGTPFFQQVILITQDKSFSGNFKDDDGLQGFDLPDGPMVDISLSRTIVKTPRAGKNVRGTVKEYISADDYKIRIRGLLVNYDGQHPPIEDTARLNQLCNIPEALEVQNELLNAMGIYNLVIENLELPSFEQFTNVQPYVISAVSDTPIELEFNPDF